MPILPFIAAMTCSRVRLAVLLPSTAIIRSPCKIPAFSAGEPLMGRITVSWSPLKSKYTPIPPKEPSV